MLSNTYIIVLGKKLRTLIFILSIFHCYQLHSAEQYGPYNADIIRVIDGDTVDVNLYVYPGQINKTRLRLALIDTPELKSKQTCERELAKKAKEFTIKFLAEGKAKVTINGMGRYGRPLANIYINGYNLSSRLLDENLARKYQPIKKLRNKWCEN